MRVDLARAQRGILDPVAAHGRSLAYHLSAQGDPRALLARLRAQFDPDWGVLGLGLPLVAAVGATVPGLRVFPALAGPGVAVPATQAALWVHVRGADASAVFDRQQQVSALLGADVTPADGVDTFCYAGGRDLTGYEDGTENPRDEDAVAVALVAEGAGLAGSSFVAVQRWVHDLACFHRHGREACDRMIGRERESNEELDDAPPSAHVKRSAQESFDPEAFMVRRSMPWSTPRGQGLEFIAYGHSLDAFEQVLRRMTGLEDGIVDALFRFSRPVTGGYYWCPPLAEGRLDLAALG